MKLLLMARDKIKPKLYKVEYLCSLLLSLLYRYDFIALGLGLHLRLSVVPGGCGFLAWLITLQLSLVIGRLGGCRGGRWLSCFLKAGLSTRRNILILSKVD
jgi:hypothetical protein